MTSQRDLEQLAINAKSVLTALKYKPRFIKGEIKNTLLVSIMLSTSEKAFPDNIRKELYNKGIGIKELKPRFFISSNGVWRALFTIYDLKDAIEVMSKSNDTKQKRKK